MSLRQGTRRERFTWPFLPKECSQSSETLTPERHHIEGRKKSSDSRCEGASWPLSWWWQEIWWSNTHFKGERKGTCMGCDSRWHLRSIAHWWYIQSGGRSSQIMQLLWKLPNIPTYLTQTFRTCCHWNWRCVELTSHRIHPRTSKTNHCRHQTPPLILMGGFNAPSNIWGCDSFDKKRITYWGPFYS